MQATNGRLTRARVTALAIAGAAWLAAIGAQPVLAQDGARGTIEKITIHSPSIEGNLQGNSAERDVLVYLPPSYGEDDTRRYPVVYQLHGWLPGAEEWAQMIELQESSDQAIASGEAREMIVVVPDSLTIYGGSMYSTSITSGDFEGFIAHDLVAEIDSRYRTIAERRSRGLSGHSMGGYGTLRIGMKHPELYSSLYAMSACCVAPFDAQGPAMEQAAAVESVEQGKEAAIFARVQLTQASAWSPNPQNPPLFYDFPLDNGAVDALALAKWNANVPLVMIDQYIPNLQQLDALALDIGLQDGLLDQNRELSDVLTGYGVEHSFETYEGDHTNRVAERYGQHVLPFFSRVLDFE